MTNEATLHFIRQHREENVRRLALKPIPEEVDAIFAMSQIAAWQTAKSKLPAWAATEGLVFPHRTAMEQCSSEYTAIYKQSIIKRILSGMPAGEPKSLMDLTGGFGIDFSYLAREFQYALYMERQASLCRIAEHNFKLLNLYQAEVRETDSALSVAEWPSVTCCFVDPARRDTIGRKTVAIEDCEPNLATLQEHIREKSLFCLIKLSPMLDIKTALRTLKNISEVHVVSLRGECKELLLVMTQEQPYGTTFHCMNLESGQPDFIFTETENTETECQYTEQPEKFLYEPNASIMKCQGFRCLSSRYSIKKLHPDSHLFCSNRFTPDFPGRVFEVDAYCGFSKKEIKEITGDIQQANLTVRNFPNTVAELRKRLKLKEGGNTYLFATTLSDGQHVLLRCHKTDSEKV